jgi:hypothetical protein
VISKAKDLISRKQSPDTLDNHALLFLVSYGDENRVLASYRSDNFGEYSRVDLYCNCRSETWLGSGYYKVLPGVV